MGRIGVRSNSRSVALAVRVIAGLIDEDFDIQLLSAWSGEYNGEREIVEEGLTDHGRRLSSMWLNLKERILVPLRRLIYTQGSKTSFRGSHSLVEMGPLHRNSIAARPGLEARRVRRDSPGRGLGGSVGGSCK